MTMTERIYIAYRHVRKALNQQNLGLRAITISATMMIMMMTTTAMTTMIIINMLVSARLTQYLPTVLTQLCCHLANEYEIMAAKEQHYRPKNITFSIWSSYRIKIRRNYQT